MLRDVGFSHDTLRLHLARLELQSMLVRVNSTCASKLPQNPRKGINTIFNHFRDKPAHELSLVKPLAAVSQ